MIEGQRTDATPHVALSAVQLLCVCDLDGTLLRSDATLSTFARDGLRRLINAGVRVTVASGRSLQAMRALLSGVELQLPVIGLNGALISDMRSGRHLLIRALGSLPACMSVAMLTASGASPLLTSWDGIHDRVHYPKTMNAASDWWVAEKREYGDPRLRTTRKPRWGCCPTGRRPDHRIRARCIRRATGRAAAGTPRWSRDHSRGAAHLLQGWTEIQIQHPQADKGHALPPLLELTGLRGSTVLACGDHLNDLGMFAGADECIAPANAHTSVLAAATSVVASNDQDGVIRWLLSRVGLTTLAS